MFIERTIQHYFKRTLSSHILSEAHQLVKTNSREFSKTRLKPFAASHDKNHSIPFERIKELSESGLMSLVIPEKYGGLGMDYLAYAIANEEISYGCASMGIMFSIHSSLYLYPIYKWGTEEQKKQFLVPFVNTEKIGCFSLSEPDNGSDAGAAKTTATLVGDHYVLNGTKAWVSNSTFASGAIVFATSDPSKKHKGISAFIVPMPTEGLIIGKEEDKMGLKGSQTCILTFDNCKIPKENLLGNEGDGFKIAMMSLDGGRIGIAAQALGIARSAYECAVEYSLTRKAFNTQISNFQAIKFKLAEMESRITAARLVTWNAALLKDKGLPFTKDSAMAKLLASETATYVCHQAMQILGGMGYVTDMPVERNYRDARITEIYEGTSEIQRLVIGDRVIKDFKEKGEIDY